LPSFRRKSSGSELPTPEEALALLKEAGCSPDVIAHSLTVTKIALRLARKLKSRGFNIDLGLVEAGALLHDLGRSKTHDVRHGYLGGEIARSIGLPKPLINIIERHVGGGITAEEAEKLGMPKRDFTPKSLEEKIVTYADKLVARDKSVNFEATLKEFSGKLGPNHPALKRLKKLRREMLEKMGDL